MRATGRELPRVNFPAPHLELLAAAALCHIVQLAKQPRGELVDKRHQRLRDLRQPGVDRAHQAPQQQHVDGDRGADAGALHLDGDALAGRPQHGAVDLVATFGLFVLLLFCVLSLLMGRAGSESGWFFFLLSARLSRVRASKQHTLNNKTPKKSTAAPAAARQTAHTCPRLAAATGCSEISE